ncbi:unnamed protein product [Blepharisma stoltei]|uniref:GAF domain-containing protein n=1 Tax=Blepharisma stoltei TaxID=1481888 RepID=A0AAU9KGF4_9CILI|nr:unnamed protein product [Blepharisma stoltei]
MSDFYQYSPPGSALMTVRTPHNKSKSRNSARSLHNSPNSGSLPFIDRAEIKTAPKPTTSNDNTERETRLITKEPKIYRATKIVLKNNYSSMSFGNVESFLNMNIEEIDIYELRKIMQELIIKQRELFRNLTGRCEILGNMIRVVENSENFSEREAKSLIQLIHEMAETAANTSEVEINFGVKSRELERRNLEFSALKSKYESLLKRSYQSENENKDLKEKLKNLQEENARQSKLTMTERQRFSQITSKIQSLEEGLQAMVMTQAGNNVDVAGKLKGAINALLRESQDYRKEIQEMKKEKDILESNIQRLNRKVTRLTIKLNEIKNRQARIEELDLPIVYKINFEGKEREMNEPRTLQYRINNLAAERKQFMNDILEHGTQALAQIYDTPSKIVYLDTVIEKMLNLNDFVEQVGLIKNALGIIAKSEDLYALINSINTEISGLLNAERCHFWIYEKSTEEIWTVANHNEHKFRADIGLFGTILNQGGYISTNSPQQENNYSPEIENAIGYHTNSLLLYPVMNYEIQQILGFLEVVNNCTGHFEHDDEYLAELILPTISSLTLKTYSNHSIVTMNRMKDDLIKCSIDLLKVTNRKDLLKISEKWICSIFSINQCRICLVCDGKIQRLSGEEVIDIPKNVGLCGLVAESQMSEHIKDPYNDTRFNSACDLEVTLPLFFIPITKKNHTIAVLQIPFKNSKSSSAKHHRLGLSQSPAIQAFGSLFVGFIKLVEEREKNKN